MSTLQAVPGTAPDPPHGGFDIEAVPEDGTRRKVPLASATRIPGLYTGLAQPGRGLPRGRGVHRLVQRHPAA